MLRRLPLVPDAALEAPSPASLDALPAGLILRCAKKVNNEAAPGRVRFEADDTAREGLFPSLSEEETQALPL